MLCCRIEFANNIMETFFERTLNYFGYANRLGEHSTLSNDGVLHNILFSLDFVSFQ